MNNLAQVVCGLVTGKVALCDIASLALSPQEEASLADLIPILRATPRSLAVLLEQTEPPEPWADGPSPVSKPALA